MYLPTFWKLTAEATAYRFKHVAGWGLPAGLMVGWIGFPSFYNWTFSTIIPPPTGVAKRWAQNYLLLPTHLPRVQTYLISVNTSILLLNLWNQIRKRCHLNYIDCLAYKTIKDGCWEKSFLAFSFYLVNSTSAYKTNLGISSEPSLIFFIYCALVLQRFAKQLSQLAWVGVFIPKLNLSSFSIISWAMCGTLSSKWELFIRDVS